VTGVGTEERGKHCRPVSRRELMTIRSAPIALASSRISCWMPPLRTLSDTRSASSLFLGDDDERFFCRLALLHLKVGRYVFGHQHRRDGNTLTSRTAPAEIPAIMTAVVTAGLASDGLPRSIGTRICLYMVQRFSQQCLQSRGTSFGDDRDRYRNALSPGAAPRRACGAVRLSRILHRPTA
jgi:hypothetical protein